VGDWNTVVGDESWHNTVGSYRMGRKKSDFEYSSIFVKYMDWLPPTHGLKSLREDCSPGKTNRLILTSVALYTCGTVIQKQYEGCADTAWSRYFFF
jgi:hypothetical protein